MMCVEYMCQVQGERIEILNLQERVSAKNVFPEYVFANIELRM